MSTGHDNIYSSYLPAALQPGDRTARHHLAAVEVHHHHRAAVAAVAVAVVQQLGEGGEHGAGPGSPLRAQLATVAATRGRDTLTRAVASHLL